MGKSLKRFTMIEILIVSAIILILGALLVGAVIQAQHEARYQRWVVYTQNIRTDDDVVAYYTFETGEGEVLVNEALGDAGDRDYRPQQFDGVIQGAEWRRTGGRWTGKWALYFDGIDDRVALGVSGGKGELGSMTILAWVRPEGVGPGTIVSADGDENWELGLSGDDGYAYRWTTTDVTGVTHVQSTEASNRRDKWRLVCGWYDRRGLLVDKRILVDGETVASSREHYGRLLGDGSTRPRTYAYIGVSSAAGEKGGSVVPGSFFRGYIDEVLIYRRALTDQEVTNHFLMGTQ